MSNKTRYFVLSAGAILVVGLTTGLLASYVGLPVAFSRAAGPDELQFVPANAAVVAYADVREVMSSEFRERFRKLEPDSAEKNEFQQKTGVNIDEDIHSVVAAMVPDGPAGEIVNPQTGMLVLARGRFDASRIEALAIEHGGRAEDYEGKRLLTHVQEGGEPAMAVGFLEADLLALGSYAAVKKAIDAGKGNNIISNNEMMTQVNELEGSSAWAVGRFDALAKSHHLPSEVQAHLPAIQWFSAATHINGGVSGIFKAQALDDQSAQNMRDMVRGFLALAKLHAGTKPELKGMVESLQISGEGKDVAVSFSLPSEFFDIIESMGKAHQLQR